MDRRILVGSFCENDIPSWGCPCCGKGSLSCLQDGFSKEYSSDIDIKHPDFDPDWISYIFTMMLECANASCKEKVACVGIGGVEQGYLGHEYGMSGWSDYFEPKLFEPALQLFSIPPDRPESVYEELQVSFSVFFKFPSLSLISLRRALEILLSELGVPTENNKGGFLSLDNRIKTLPKDYKHIIEPVMAIKWLGNEGAHGDQASSEDVLDGYDIFEHVLNELYPVKKAPIAGIVQRINTAKGIGK